jgi:hypothetical protein
MRTRRRVAFILASAAAFGVGLIATGSAAAEPIVPACTYGAGHVGGADTANKSCIKLAVPAAQPGTFANTKLGVRTRTLYSTSNPNAGGKAKTVTLFFDNDFSVTQGTIPKCQVADVSGKTIPQAYAACGPAGKNAYLSPAGTISGRTSTAPPSNWGGCTMVFNGPGVNQVLLYARVTAVNNSNPTCSTPGGSSAGNVTVTLVGTIAAANLAGYGKKLTVPNINSLALALDDFYATVQRGSFFRARCPAGANPWKLRGTFLYSGTGNPTDTYNTTAPCN